MKKTLVIGASEKPEKYFHEAISTLVEKGYEVNVLGLKNKIIKGAFYKKGKEIIPNIHTISLYINAENQLDYYDYIEKLHPKRVIFNPGAENIELETRLKVKGIDAQEICTLFLLHGNLY